VILPMMAGLAAVAEPLTVVVLGEKWLPAVPFIQICCFSYAFWPIHTTNLSAINAVGRSDIFLKLEFIKKGYCLAALLLALFLFRSPIGIAIASAVTAPLGAFVNAHPNKKLLNYGYLEQMKDIMPSFGLSIAMGVGVYLLSSMIAIPAVLQLVVLTIAGMAFYFLCAKLFKLECLNYIIQTVKEMKNKKGLLK
jgi:O-antigen/teichoic acid export membrane protein